MILHSRDASIRSQPSEYSSSSDRSEEPRTPDSIDEPWEGSDGRGSPQGGRRYPGVQMMGSGLLAEMKAKQERRAHKVRRDDFLQCYKCSALMCEGCTQTSMCSSTCRY